MDVYRKPTHTDRYLDFFSHHPSCHKRSVVNTLLLRSRNIPSTSKGKREETRWVKAVLGENNYPSRFINECERALATKPTKPTTNGFVVLPYVKFPSSHREPSTVFFLDRNSRMKPTVHHLEWCTELIACSQCDFVYYGQTERSLKMRVSEHKKAVLMFDHNSKLACHVQECHHHMDFENVEVVGHEVHYHQRLFREAWMSVKDPNAGNDHIVIPEVYLTIRPVALEGQGSNCFSITQLVGQKR